MASLLPLNLAARTPHPWLVGVDGCRAGWVVVLAPPLTHQGQEPAVEVCASFAEVLRLTPAPAVMALDMPIGLLTDPRPGGRDCDQLARRLLGRRASCIFTPPTRPMLAATHYAEVRSQGLSIQSFHLLPKIRDVDALMTPALQQRVYEAHPELAFRSVAGQALLTRKKTLAGRTERLQFLERLPPSVFRHTQRLYAQALQRWKRADLAPDDVVDALVLVWTAWRIGQGVATCLPPQPVYDARGLRMAIWA